MLKLVDMFEEKQGEILYLYFSRSAEVVELHGYENIQRFYQRWQVGKPIPENWREELAADTSPVRPKAEQPFLTERGGQLN